MSAVLAAVCGLLLALAARELWADGGERTRLGARRRLRPLTSRLPGRRPAGGREPGGLTSRLRRAGLADRVQLREVVLARVACGISALPVVAIERVAARRRTRIGTHLADALELIAVAAGGGNNVAALLAAARDAASGPLREELAATVAELECGVRHSEALRRLGRRAGPELAGLGVLLERSRRLGSPLAEGLQRQAAELREERARGVEERAARAAPKIQLVVALLFVPSVLLLVAAAILANADALTAGL
jgi:tight adherence protein C